MQKLFEENPHPAPNIGLVIWTPLHYYVLKNIARNLPCSEFIIAAPKYLNGKGCDTYIRAAVSLLKSDGVHWRVFTKYGDARAIRKFFEPYAAILATRLWRPLKKIRYSGWLEEKKFILVGYGAGKDLVTASPWTCFFDLVLAEGQHTHDIYRTFSNSRIVGVPKYDDWFSGNIDRTAIERIGVSQDSSKKTVLYLPTHGPFSSIRYYAGSIAKLAGSYNVICKLHYLNNVVDVPYVAALRNTKIRIYKDTTDVLLLFSLADIVVSDSSSAALEAILVDKPLVILDTDKYAAQLSPRTKIDETIWQSSLQMHEASIEQKIKNKDDMRVGTIVRSGEELRGAIGNAEILHIHHRGNRARIREHLFAYADGKCGERAATAINEFINSPKQLPLAGLATRLYLRDRYYEFQKKKKNAEPR